jgi:hypothetical protein
VSSVRTSIGIGGTTTLSPSCSSRCCLSELQRKRTPSPDRHADDEIGMSFDTNALAGPFTATFPASTATRTRKARWGPLTDLTGLNPATALARRPIGFWKNGLDGKKGTTVAPGRSNP